MMQKRKNKDLNRVWIAILLSFFSWVPILNLFFFLPLAYYFIIKQLFLIKRQPERYGGLMIAVFCLIGFTFLIIISIRGLLISMES